MCLQTQQHQACPQPPGAGGSRDLNLPLNSRKEYSPPPPGFWTSRLQNWERINLNCFKSPGCGNSLQHHGTLMQTPTNENPNTLSLHHMESWSNRLLLSDLGGWPTLPLELLANHLSPRQGQHWPCLSHIPRARWVHSELNYTPSPPAHQPHGLISQPLCLLWPMNFRQLLSESPLYNRGDRYYLIGLPWGLNEIWWKIYAETPSAQWNPVCLLFSWKRRKRAVLWIVEGKLDYISENQVFISFFFWGGAPFANLDRWLLLSGFSPSKLKDGDSGTGVVWKHPQNQHLWGSREGALGRGEAELQCAPKKASTSPEGPSTWAGRLAGTRGPSVLPRVFPQRRFHRGLSQPPFPTPESLSAFVLRETG